MEQAKVLSGCDRVLCLMSGPFTQRGDMCRNDKYQRARHAVLCGADCVAELPAPFAVAPAEIFARGAIKLIGQIDGDITLAFGCESGNAEDFIEAARILSEESPAFKYELNKNLDRGESYIKSYAAAFETCGGKRGLLSSPNNILGVEYAKAVLRSGKNARILPIKRIGADFNDEGLKPNYSSAGAIRANADDPIIKDNMPECSYTDFTAAKDLRERFEQMAADCLYMRDKEDLKRVYGCTEGLENKLKKLADGRGYAQIIEDAAGKRYSRTRIKRILCANLLGLYADETEKFLNCDLPLKALAVKKDCADEILPLLSSPADGGRCMEINSAAYALWRYINHPADYKNEREKTVFV